MFSTPTHSNAMEDVYTDPASQSGLDANSYLKRKRSNSPDRLGPAKITKTLPGANIDFLASIHGDVLPLVDTEDSLRFVQQHFEQYSGVIERHESLAANLGAKLQAPNSIKRFERLFMNPIKILQNNGKEGNTVTWLDIVKFYDDKPGHFKLNQRDGEKVCQFYTKQCRVEISADEFEFIQSGQPQRMLPSGTVPADEEKELGTIEFMETRIGQIIKLADQVSGRGKQLMSRLKARRNALAAKRDVEVNGGQAASEGSPSDHRSGSPVSGFTVVNSSRDGAMTNGGITTTSSFSKPLVSSGVKAELSLIFSGNRDRSVAASGEYPIRTSKSRNRNSDYGYGDILAAAATPTQPATPGLSSAANVRLPPVEKADNDGPFKAEMLARMEKMSRYANVHPPCDRCRRLNIDCQKNLTACLGCTRKHAKCSWKEVTQQELDENPTPVGTGSTLGRPRSMSGSDDAQAADVALEPVLDKELLGEDYSEDEDVEPGAMDRVTPTPAHTMPVDESNSELLLPKASPDTAASSAHAPAISMSQSHPSLPTHLASTHQEAQAAVHSLSDHEQAEVLGGHGGAEVSDDATGNPASSSKAEEQVKTEPKAAEVHRLPGFPSILGDRLADNPAILGTANGNRLAHETQSEIERLQPDGPAQHQQPATNGLNGMTKV